MVITAHSRLLGIVGGTIAALSLSVAHAQFDSPYPSQYSPDRGYDAYPSPYAAPGWQERGFGYGGPGPQGFGPPPWARMQHVPPQGGYWGGGPQGSSGWMPPHNPYMNGYGNGGYGGGPWATSPWGMRPGRDEYEGRDGGPGPGDGRYDGRYEGNPYSSAPPFRWHAPYSYDGYYGQGPGPMRGFSPMNPPPTLCR